MCKNFADRVVSTNLDEYSKRNQFNKEKIKHDIFIGKLAEWGVYFLYLERNRKNIDPPDMMIYGKSKKSFDTDLSWGLFKLHIKAQDLDSANRYGDSWLFQIKDPLFDYANEYDIIIACSVGNNYEVSIKLEKPFKNLIFSKPKLAKLVDNKKALYLRDNDG
jgi:hypothetical protein